MESNADIKSRLLPPDADILPPGDDRKKKSCSFTTNPLESARVEPSVFTRTLSTFLSFKKT